MREDGDLRGWTRVDVLPPDGMQEIHAPLRGAPVGTKLGPELGWSAGAVAVGLAWRIADTGRAAARLGLACRLPSPIRLGPFEAVYKSGAGAPCRVPPVAAACACVSLLY